jgi:hypothetical protein
VARPGPKRAIPIRPQTALYLLHYVQADLQFQTVSQGYDHVLVIEDRFTKFCCLYPITGKETVTVAKEIGKLHNQIWMPNHLGHRQWWRIQIQIEISLNDI